MPKESLPTDVRIAQALEQIAETLESMHSFHDTLKNICDAIDVHSVAGSIQPLEKIAMILADIASNGVPR